MIFLLVTIVFVVFISLLILSFEWTEFNRKKPSSYISPRIKFIKPKFDEFLKLYAESSDKWNLKKDNVSFCSGRYGSPELKVRFSFIDYLKYRLFFMKCNFHTKKDASQKEKEQMERALNALQEEVRRNTR